MPFADDAALVGHSKGILQRLISWFIHACREFAFTISLNKTKTLGQDVNGTPSISIVVFTLKVLEELIFSGYTISSNLSFDTEFKKRISKAATDMSHI